MYMHMYMHMCMHMCVLSSNPTQPPTSQRIKEVPMRRHTPCGARGAQRLRRRVAKGVVSDAQCCQRRTAAAAHRRRERLGAGVANRIPIHTEIRQLWQLPGRERGGEGLGARIRELVVAEGEILKVGEVAIGEQGDEHRHACVRHAAARVPPPPFDYSLVDLAVDFNRNPGGPFKVGGTDQPDEFPLVEPRGAQFVVLACKIRHV